MRSAFLRGREQHRIGGLELVAEGPTAIALSRGGARKTYSHTDPNEDSVAFAMGEGGQLIIATDGHHGALGSEAAVQTILDEFAEPWTARNSPIQDPADWSRLGLEALARANRAILEIAGRHQLPPAPTTFVLALVRPEDDLLLHVSIGDSHLFVVDRGEALELGGLDSSWKFTPFLGYEETTAERLEKFTVIGQRGLEGLRAIVLATDGLSELGIGVQNPAQSVFATVSQIELEAPPDRRAVDTCRHITEIALRSHRQKKAGDNIGCSVIWLGD